MSYKDGKFDKKEVLADYKLANLSRQVSLIGRKEVLTGKAKFGIFGDGKEVPQLAMAKQFRKGDYRSGYYRDQTFVMAAGIFTAEEFFAQLYGDTDLEKNPSHGGRSFNNHFGTRYVNPDGSWNNMMEIKNTAADLSPTAGQMPRLVGLAYASKLFRNNKELHSYTHLSNKGNEVAFGMIGDASTAEGHFFETMNAAAVLQVPLAVAVWDDEYGISVHKSYQIVKSSISEALKGFQKEKKTNGVVIYKAKGWDYPTLCKIFEEGIDVCRREHVPVLFHIEEITQPQGHSTSGSHERYKSKERLEWEAEHDCIKKMREWIIAEKIATSAELDELEKQAAQEAKKAKEKAWVHYTEPIKKERDALLKIISEKQCPCRNGNDVKISEVADGLSKITSPVRRDNFSAAKKILRYICSDCPSKNDLRGRLNEWLRVNRAAAYDKYSTFIYNETPRSAIRVKGIKPIITPDSPMVHGREILRDNFDILFSRYPTLVTFGEDTGKLGDVNQCLEGMQAKYGELRVTDTGIRETTIIGQGIGLAMRGLRPIAEIQYFDYLLYALQTLSDDLATLHWRTCGGQIAPVIIRTRGHRLEGIWHAGSPMGMVINAIRGIYVCVPRNMTQAAGFYNTLLKGEDTALVIEPLNGYRVKEPMPQNLGEYCTPLGIPEIMVEGTDITIVTYGSCVRIAQEAVEQLKEFDIHCELIDIQTLLPFDTHQIICESIKKTNRVLFFDEDVPGGATAYMMQHVLEFQGAYQYLDSQPRTMSAREHRPAYATDGDYFSNPNSEDVFEMVYEMMHEANPNKYPKIYNFSISYFERPTLKDRYE